MYGTPTTTRAVYHTPPPPTPDDEVKVLQKTIHDMEEEAAEMRTELNNMASRLHTQTQDLEVAGAAGLKLQHEIAGLKESLASLAASRDEAEERVHTLEREKRASANAVVELKLLHQEECLNLAEQITVLNEALEEAEAESKVEKKKTRLLDADLDAANGRIHELQEEIMGLKQAPRVDPGLLAERDALETELTATKAKMAAEAREAQDVLASLKKELETIRTAARASQTTAAQASAAAKKAKAKQEEAEKALGQAKEQLAELGAQVAASARTRRERRAPSPSMSLADEISAQEKKATSESSIPDELGFINHVVQDALRALDGHFALEEKSSALDIVQAATGSRPDSLVQGLQALVATSSPSGDSLSSMVASVAKRHTSLEEEFMVLRDQFLKLSTYVQSLKARAKAGAASGTGASGSNQDTLIQLRKAKKTIQSLMAANKVLQAGRPDIVQNLTDEIRALKEENTSLSSLVAEIETTQLNSSSSSSMSLGSSSISGVNDSITSVSSCGSSSTDARVDELENALQQARLRESRLSSQVAKLKSVLERTETKSSLTVSTGQPCGKDEQRAAHLSELEVVSRHKLLDKALEAMGHLDATNFSLRMDLEAADTQIRFDDVYIKDLESAYKENYQRLIASNAAQVEDLEAKLAQQDAAAETIILRQKKSIEDAQASVSSLSTQVCQAKDRVAALEADLSAAQAKGDVLAAQVSALTQELEMEKVTVLKTQAELRMARIELASLASSAENSGDGENEQASSGSSASSASVSTSVETTTLTSQDTNQRRKSSSSRPSRDAYKVHKGAAAAPRPRARRMSIDDLASGRIAGPGSPYNHAPGHFNAPPSLRSRSPSPQRTSSSSRHAHRHHQRSVSPFQFPQRQQFRLR